MTHHPFSADLFDSIRASFDSIRASNGQMCRDGAQMRETIAATRKMIDASFRALGGAGISRDEADTLFTNSLQLADAPSDICPSCRNIMGVETIKAKRHLDIYQFRCPSCGVIKGRTVLREFAASVGGLSTR